ncbi:MAG TPA: GIY-YIG nuclease family protein [Melioribacteraceae bacterium]|nr:GIY-YIG nuclease family protein [Melioribacteraceae bacterium]
MYYVYVLKSLVKERFYIGHTSDLQNRLNEHNSGRTKSTKTYIPWSIIYTETYLTRSEAYKRELEIKSYKSGIKFKQLLKLESWQSG